MGTIPIQTQTAEIKWEAKPHSAVGTKYFSNKYSRLHTHMINSGSLKHEAKSNPVYPATAAIRDDATHHVRLDPTCFFTR